MKPIKYLILLRFISPTLSYAQTDSQIPSSWLDDKDNIGLVVLIAAVLALLIAAKFVKCKQDQ